MEHGRKVERNGTTYTQNTDNIGRREAPILVIPEWYAEKSSAMKEKASASTSKNDPTASKNDARTPTAISA